MNAAPVNSPSPAALITTAVYVRYEEHTREEERDDLERVLLFGGKEHTNPYISTPRRDRGSWIYTPSENSWFHLQSIGQPPDRFGHSLTTLCRNRVVLYGGILNSYISGNDWTLETEVSQPPDNLWVFDGIREVWQEEEVEPSNIRPRGRAFHSATAVDSVGNTDNGFYCAQSLFIFGGITRFLQSESPNLWMLHDLWELQFKLVPKDHRKFWQWKQHHQEKAPFWPSERYLHSAVSLDNGTMLMFGGKLGNRKKFIRETFVWAFNVSSSSWDRRSLSHPNPSSHVERGAIAFNSTGRTLFQVQNGLVYVFSKATLAWTENMTSVSSFTPITLAYFAAVVVGPAILVFAGVEPHTSFLTMRVWSIEEIAGSWVWQLCPAPRRSPPLQALASWNVIDDRLVFCASTPHEWSTFLLDKWSKLISTNFTQLAKGVIRENSILVQQCIDDMEAHFTNMSNSVWQMDLTTKVWWQYSTGGNRPLFYTASTSMDHELGKMLVTYGGVFTREYKDTLMALSLALNGSDVFVYLLERRRWKKTVLYNSVQTGPGPRVYSAIVDTGDRKSMVLFGGAIVDVATLNTFISLRTLDIADPIRIQDCCKNFALMKNDVWRLTIVSPNGTHDVDGDGDLRIEWTLLKNGTDRPDVPVPKARVGHHALRLDGKIAIWGGMRITLANQEWFTCLDDLWIFDLNSLEWTKYEEAPAAKASNCWTQRKLCTPPAAAVGTRIITIFQSGLTCNHPYLQSFMVTAGDENVWENHTNETLPFRPEILFLWNDRIVSVNQELLGNDVHEHSSELGLSLDYQDSVYVSEMRPGCEAGYNSSNWTTMPCQKCPEGFYADVGAMSCSLCPEGLSTFLVPASSDDSCLCDPSYCFHGRCFIANSKGHRTAECLCNIGFMGQKCEYPTYFIIAAVSLVALVIVIVSVVLFRQMMKYRKQKMVREVELEVMRNVWTINSSEIQLLDRIDDGAPGSYGDVYKARYRDMSVALKKLKLQTREFARDFLNETELMKSMRHRNIVLFIGAGKFETNDCPFLVLEYMQNGALTSILRNMAIEISRKQQLRFCLDAAKGMEFLHSQRPPRIHRDLKSSNLLVSACWVVKVADFGCARLVKRQGESQSVAKRCNTRNASLNNAREPLLMADRDLSDNVGAALWRAPEIFACKPYGTAVDVYRYSTHSPHINFPYINYPTITPTLTLTQNSTHINSNTSTSTH